MIEPAAPVAGGSAPAAGGPVAGGSTRADRSADPVSRGFEKLLVQQLAKAMLDTAGDAGGAYASLLPDALADAVEDAGGLGFDLGTTAKKVGS